LVCCNHPYLLGKRKFWCEISQQDGLIVALSKSGLFLKGCKDFLLTFLKGCLCPKLHVDLVTIVCKEVEVIWFVVSYILTTPNEKKLNILHQVNKGVEMIIAFTFLANHMVV